MNLRELFIDDRLPQTKKIFSLAETVLAIQIKAGGQLREHVKNMPAILGKVFFKNKKGGNEGLASGAFSTTDPYVKHWVVVEKNNNLLEKGKKFCQLC